MNNSKKKIVYVLHDIEIGGIEVALLSAIPRLCQKYDLTVIVLGHINEMLVNHFSTTEREAFKAFNYPLYIFPFKINTIIRYIVSLQPEQLVCSLWRASWIGVKIKKRLRNIQFYSFIHSTKYFHFLDRFFTHRAIKTADTILVDSLSSLYFVEQQANLQTKINVVSFLTNRTSIVNPSIDKSTTFGERKIKFLFVGRIAKVKNLSLSIKLFSKLVEKSYDVAFDIYGRPDDDYMNCRMLVEEMNLTGYVSFKGEIDPQNRFSVFREYDFYLQLSKFEGMAMSVAEAMQNGLVCIVSPVGEILNYSSDGTSAIFVDYQNKESLQDAIRRVEEVINDHNLYGLISKNCFNNFFNRGCYADSFIECLNNGIDC